MPQNVTAAAAAGNCFIRSLARNLSLNVILKVRIDGPKECHNKTKLLTMFRAATTTTPTVQKHSNHSSQNAC